jgi:copper(I)-binding protein
MTLINQGNEAITLTSASVSADLVGEVQIHTTVMQDDMMKMVHLHDGIVVPAGESIALKPGGYHIMLMGLKKGLSEGGSLPITLHFDKQEAVTVEAAVKRIDKTSHHHHH